MKCKECGDESGKSIRCQFCWDCRNGIQEHPSTYEENTLDQGQKEQKPSIQYSNMQNSPKTSVGKCKHCDKLDIKVCKHNHCASCSCPDYCWID